MTRCQYCLWCTTVHMSLIDCQIVQDDNDEGNTHTHTRLLLVKHPADQRAKHIFILYIQLYISFKAFSNSHHMKSLSSIAKLIMIRDRDPFYDNHKTAFHTQIYSFETHISIRCYELAATAAATVTKAESSTAAAAWNGFHRPDFVFVIVVVCDVREHHL